MNVFRQSILLIAGPLLLLCGSVCIAQAVAPPALAAATEPISTDRPSVATGTALVPVHTLQFENGINWTRDQSTNSGDAPETELRFGLTNRVEIEAFVPNLNWSGAFSGVRTTDFSLGAKIRIASDKRNWPVSIVGALTFPTGSQELTSGGVDPVALVTVQHNLPHNFQLVGSGTLASLSTNGSGRVAQSQLAFDLGWCANARTCFYAEEAPFLSTAQNSSGTTTDGGMTFGVTTRTQVDWRVGTTVENGDHSFFATLGYSFRLDHLRPRH
jgi:hypothetical protein